MSEPITTSEAAPRPRQIDQEYVVSDGAWLYRGQRSRARALPWAFDDVTDDFGDDLYDQMAHDARITACDLLLRAAIAEEGIALSPAIADEGQDGYTRAVELVDFCAQQLEDLETPIDDVLWDLLECISRGSRVAEITYHPMDRSPLPGRAVLQRLAVKPRRATAFVVDPYMRLIGLLAQEETALLGTGQLLAPDDARILPREKFAIASHHPRNSDVRGTSAWRAAYNPWWLKMQTWQEYLKYLAQFASGTVVGKVAPDAQDRIDPTTGKKISPVQDLLNHLLAIQNGSAIAVPSGTEVDVLFSTGEGAAFLNAFTLYNQEITIAITSQTLTGGEAQFGTRAQASVHQDALGTLVRQGKRALCRTLRRDVLRHLVRYNYGDAAIPLTPKVSLGEVEQQDIAALLTAFANLYRSGYVHPSQQPGIDRLLSLPPRVITPADAQAPSSQNQGPSQGQKNPSTPDQPGQGGAA